ncbi:MAG TPA: hypothetical protein VN066_02925 [Rhodocyclaceae bacterium]|nr:hypothetical protein [Rhodocyclaceae bacterium]
MKHLFVDISSHGLGHLAQTAPILNALAARRPLRLTVRSGLTQAQLAGRIQIPFAHIHAASDFGFVMHDAINVDLEASAARYRSAYADWSESVEQEARLLKKLGLDLVVSNVSPLPLAGAAAAGIPALAMSSLNWDDLFCHYYGTQAWAAPIHAAMHAAYAGARRFLRLSPGMPMSSLDNVTVIGPVAGYTQGERMPARADVADRLGLPLDKRWLLIAMGGIAHRLPIEDWPELPGFQLLVPAAWEVQARNDISVYSEAVLPFAELFPTVDVVLCKPGYGTFVEAACCGIPVLYLPRPDWPEADFLTQWLEHNGRTEKLAPQVGIDGRLATPLAKLLARPVPPRPRADGIADALRLINEQLDEGDSISA